METNCIYYHTFTNFASAFILTNVTFYAILIYMREVTLTSFNRTANEQMRNLPVVVTNFGKPYAKIHKMSEEEGKKYLEEKILSMKPKFYFDNKGTKICTRHNVMWPLCGCS